MQAERTLLPLSDPRVASAIELVWHEASLLDEKRYEDWERLWAPDGLYVIPIDPDAEDFATVLNMVYDDARMRRMRVERLVSGYSISVTAAARTVRTVSRFTAAEGPDGAVELRSAQVLVGHKRDVTFVVGADLTHWIRVEDGIPRLARKVVRLVDSEAAVDALGFLL